MCQGHCEQARIFAPQTPRSAGGSQIRILGRLPAVPGEGHSFLDSAARGPPRGGEPWCKPRILLTHFLEEPQMKKIAFLFVILILASISVMAADRVISNGIDPWITAGNGTT